MFIDNNLLIIHDSADNNLKREMSLKKTTLFLLNLTFIRILMVLILLSASYRRWGGYTIH